MSEKQQLLTYFSCFCHESDTTGRTNEYFAMALNLDKVLIIWWCFSMTKCYITSFMMKIKNDSENSLCWRKVKKMEITSCYSTGFTKITLMESLAVSSQFIFIIKMVTIITICGLFEVFQMSILKVFLLWSIALKCAYS